MKKVSNLWLLFDGKHKMILDSKSTFILEVFRHLTLIYVKSRTRHSLNFYQSDTCWRIPVKYRRFFMYSLYNHHQGVQMGKYWPKTILQINLMLRGQMYFHKISRGTWYSPPITCLSMCLVSTHHRFWRSPFLSSLRL